MKKFIKNLILFCGVLVIFACAKNGSKDPVDVVKPFYGFIKQSVSTTGTVKPQNRLEIKPPVGGRVEQINVREGDNVKAGQILALLSSTERASLLDAARLQDAETLEYWQDVYKPAPLVSPINGVVIVRSVEPGQSVTAGDTVLVLSDRLVVVAQVDETDVGYVKNKQPAKISLDAYPEIKVNGLVDHISFESQLINNVNIYEVDIAPEKVPDVFRSGMSANVEITYNVKENIMLLPLGAVQQSAGGSFVEVDAGKPGEKTAKVKVETGLMDDDNIEIVSGLKGDENIIAASVTGGKSNSSGKNPFMPQRPGNRVR